MNLLKIQNKTIPLFNPLTIKAKEDGMRNFFFFLISMVALLSFLLIFTRCARDARVMDIDHIVVQNQTTDVLDTVYIGPSVDLGIDNFDDEFIIAENIDVGDDRVISYNDFYAQDDCYYDAVAISITGNVFQKENLNLCMEEVYEIIFTEIDEQP